MGRVGQILRGAGVVSGKGADIINDEPWKLEMADFLEDIRLNRTPWGGLREGLAALRVVASIYRKSGYVP